MPKYKPIQLNIQTYMTLRAIRGALDLMGHNKSMTKIIEYLLSLFLDDSIKIKPNKQSNNEAIFLLDLRENIIHYVRQTLNNIK